MMLCASWSFIAALGAVSAHALSFQSGQEPLRDETLPPIYNVPPEKWQELNDTVGGRLYTGLPMAYPCYNNDQGSLKGSDVNSCTAIELQKNDTAFVANQSGGYILGNWGVCQSTAQGCQIPLNTTEPPNGTCSQGSVPPYYIDVREASDVQAGLALAQTYGFPVVVKNTGHDYKGRSSAPNALSFWMHNYQPPMTLAKDFVPEGCEQPAGDVVTFGAGQQWDGIYKFADANNVTVPGGSSSTVGAAGGWISGGGHSALSPIYGLGVDNTRQLRVVLPNGTYVTANACQHQDIFFALRGGGGGTFGVVMEMSTEAHPQTPIQYATFTISNTNFSIYEALVDVLVTQANGWASEGWGGYSTPINTHNAKHDVILLNPLLDSSSARESLSPLIEFADSIGANWTLQSYPSWYDAYSQDIATGLVHTANYGSAMSSRLIPSANFASPENRTALASAIHKLPNGTHGFSLVPMFLLVTPSAYTLPPNSPPASISPAWREATWHVLVSAVWDPYYATVDSINNAFQAVNAAMQPLRELTTGGGAYLNEADTFEPDPEGTFWGAENYDMLLNIKKAVDPGNIMQVHQGVGWDPYAPDGRWACYPQDPNNKIDYEERICRTPT